MPKNWGAFIKLHSDDVTPELVYQNTEWPAEGEKLEDNPDLATALLLIRMQLAEHFISKKRHGANAIVNQLDAIYEKADIPPQKWMERKIANLQAVRDAMQEISPIINLN